MRLEEQLLGIAIKRKITDRSSAAPSRGPRFLWGEAEEALSQFLLKTIGAKARKFMRA
jgi:hypothetical protein